MRAFAGRAAVDHLFAHFVLSFKHDVPTSCTNTPVTLCGFGLYCCAAVNETHWQCAATASASSASSAPRWPAPAAWSAGRTAPSPLSRAPPDSTPRRRRCWSVPATARASARRACAAASSVTQDRLAPCAPRATSASLGCACSYRARWCRALTESGTGGTDVLPVTCCVPRTQHISTARPHTQLHNSTTYTAHINSHVLRRTQCPRPQFTYTPTYSR